MFTRNGLTGIAAAIAVALLAGTASATPEGWTNSLQKARETAKKHDRAILVNFTGSNWCGWCMKLKEEVFSTSEFKKWAGKNVVLLELDFPRPDNQPGSIQKQNAAMMEKYGVQGFPTILFIEADGTLIGQSGYMAGGAAKWIANAEAILKDRPRPAELELAASLQAGLEKAEKSGRPLLLIASTKAAESQLKPAVSDQKVIKLANAYFVNVHVELTKEPAKEVADLLKRYELKDGPVLLAALNVGETKTLYQTNKAPTASQLNGELRKLLPKVEYNGEWIEDLDKAQLIAMQQDRPMMLDFTGSDWCIWCKRLDGEIFSTEAFQNYARENLVLVKLDFPKQKEQSAELKAQNLAAARKFGIRGFPTLVLLDSEGKEIGKMGYMQGGPDPFLKKLKETLSQ